MNVGGALLLAMLGACGQETGSGLPEEVLLLARIKVKMEENLARLPNYTCVQTIERSRRRNSSRRFELADTLRLEVALVEGKEMFAWPGGEKFEDRELSLMVDGGAIGNGNFALHARSVFLGNTATFRYGGRERRGARETVRYDYTVPVNLSGYVIRVPPEKAVVGYHGSFWVDANTLDLVRLEVYADDIPSHLGLAAASDSMNYARVPIGDSHFLLPESSELIMTDLQGRESRNRVHFSACRQYTGQSTLSFADPGPQEPLRQEAVTEVQLPAELQLELQMDSEIDLEKSAAGDPVSATLTRAVKHSRKVLLPKGARFSGRITRLQHYRAAQSGHIVGLRFDLAEFEQARAPIFANLDQVLWVGGFGPSSRSARANRVPLERIERPGEGLFFVPSPRLRLPRGLRMIWRTLERIPNSHDQEKP
jgi:hypothetical protein